MSRRRSAPWRRLFAIFVVAAAVAAGPQVAAAASAPVARWSFEEGTGSVAADSVGDLDGTLEAGADWLTSGAIEGDGALDLPTDGAVRVPNAPALEPGELTISAWVRSDTPPDVGDVIIEKGAFGCDGPSYRALCLRERSRDALPRVVDLIDDQPVGPRGGCSGRPLGR